MDASLVNRVTKLTALVFFIVMVLLLCSVSVHSCMYIACYYLQDIDVEKISWRYWSILILEPDESNSTIVSIAKQYSVS